MAEPAADSVVKLLTTANHDLNLIYHALEKEFNQAYHDNANPLRLVSRIKKIQEDLMLLKEQSRMLLAAKQELIDKTRTTLLRNRRLFQRLQASCGLLLTNDSDDSTFRNFNQIIDEWTTQIRSKTVDGHPGSACEDINQLLFSSIVNN